MEKVKIVAYEKKYNDGIADCMIESSDYWGGSITFRTSGEVDGWIKTMDYEEIFLALLEDRVIGICTLEKFWADRNVLYVGFLNVTPEFHGMKIGKKLLLRALEKSVELKKPELDLYTWAGNTKAVPLYKKCGFFWEKRDKNIRLINYIPFIMNNELLKNYLADFHWYEDYKREIILEPDGRPEGDFEFYDYIWEKDDKKFILSFEVKGHGLTKIDCEDFMIKMELKEKRVIVGKESKVLFKIVNKSGKPLNVEIKGKDDEVVKFGFSESAEIENEKIIEAEFEVMSSFEVRNDTKRIPGVCAGLKINGKEIEFRKGIYPLNPLKIDLITKSEEAYENSYQKIFLEVENNLSYKTSFHVDLPEIPNFQSDQKSLEIDLDGFGRKSIQITGFLKNSAVIDGCLSYHEKGYPGEIFEEKISGGFSTHGNTFVEENRGNRSIGLHAGRFEARYFSRRNQVGLTKDGVFLDFEPAFYSPKIGKPYSAELELLKPLSVECFSEKGEECIQMEYVSHEYESLKIKNRVYLSRDGLAKRKIILENTSKEVEFEDLWVADPFYKAEQNSYVPYKNGIMCVRSDADTFQINYENLTENWMFSKGKNCDVGICWDKNLKIELNGFLFNLHHRAGNLKPGEKWESPFIYISVEGYDMESFRKFALKNSDPDTLHVFDETELVINDGNPVLKENFDVYIRNELVGDFDGNAKISSKKHCFDEIQIKTPEKKNIKLLKRGKLDIIKEKLNNGNFKIHKKMIYPVVGTGEVEYSEFSDGIKVVNNGKIEMKASEKFPNTLYSIKYNGFEWLENSYPEAGPFSWWNPWTGGIANSSSDLEQTNFMKEPFKVEYSEKKDNFGNVWKGLSLITGFKESEKYRGLEVRQNFLLLPGVELLSVNTELFNDTGKLLDGYRNITCAFLHLEEKFKSSWFKVEYDDCSRKYITGSRENVIDMADKITVGSDERKDRINIFSADKKPGLVGYSNILTLFVEFEQRATIESGQRKALPPVFFAFSKKDIKKKLFSEILKIRF